MGIGRSLSIYAAILLMGCQGETGSSSTPAVAATVRALPVVKRPPTVQELTAGMVEAATLGGSQLPVEVKFDVSSRPTVGLPLEVAIAVLPQVAAAPASVRLTGSDGVAVAASDSQFSLGNVESQHAYRRRITVTPTREGFQMVALEVFMTRDEGAESRRFSVPLIVFAAR